MNTRQNKLGLWTIQKVLMKRIPTLFSAAALLFSSCERSDSSDKIVSQQFVHKYGFDLSEEEWQQRSKEGRVISTLQNGVTMTHSYENGKLHGITTQTFPHTSTIEKLSVYDQGILLKEVFQDMNGIPIQEEVYEFDNRKIVTFWDERGVPLSIEEYQGDLLTDGKYYSPDHTLETQVEAGFGERVKRDRSGLLIERDTIEQGKLVARTNYHPNGHIHTISSYNNYELHGEQLKFTVSARPLMSLHWDHGVLNGLKTIYRNGLKAVEIPYAQGVKQGVERHYDDLGVLTTEIEWRSDKRHGCSKFYTEESSESEWFFNDLAVSADRFEVLDARERLVAEFNHEEAESTSQP
ncbi:MAG: hypothetical protein HY861_05035 [Chlamydiia bacterium]|nr:hypothetical protein [Chlamydiia bacterium]